MVRNYSVLSETITKSVINRKTPVSNTYNVVDHLVIWSRAGFLKLELTKVQMKGLMSFEKEKWMLFCRWHCKCVCLNENIWISINISLKSALMSQINYIPALVQIMAWRWPGSAFIKADQLDPWIKDQIKITLLPTISHLQLPNFVSCGRACPSHMTQNLVTVGAQLWTAERFLVDPWSMDYADPVW